MPVKSCGNRKQPGSTIRHRQESGAVHWASVSCLATAGDLRVVSRKDSALVSEWVFVSVQTRGA